MTSDPGYFIVLEGIDGAGKSSSVPHILKLIENSGREAVHTREPGGVPLAEGVREILLSTDNKPCPTTELLLFFAARIQHAQDLILPALQAGKVVLCDRFTPSSYAYQGGARGVDMGLIRELERQIPDACRPNLFLWLDLPVVMARKRQLRNDKDRFHQEAGGEMTERIRQVYHDLAADDPARRWERIDAGQSREQMLACITDIILERLPPKA